MRVRIKKTGKVLHVSGKPPEKKGDRFEASDVATEPKSSGCRIEVFEGGAAFSCNRSRSTSYGSGTRVYQFDPEIHELV